MPLSMHLKTFLVNPHGKEFKNPYLTKHCLKKALMTEIEELKLVANADHVLKSRDDFGIRLISGVTDILKAFAVKFERNDLIPTLDSIQASLIQAYVEKMKK